jgi:heme exporter protein B
MKRLLAVLAKEVKLELRNRYTISTVFLFALTTVSIVVFSVADTKFSEAVASAFIWVIVFFGSVTGLGKSFVSEEERGTMLLLRITSDAHSVYLGKLFYNIIISLLISFVSIVLLLIFNSSIIIRNAGIFWLTVLLSSLSFASASTIISAIVSKSNSRSILLVVLSFPILLPNLLLGIESTKMGLEGWEFADFQSNFGLFISYFGVMSTVSYFLYEQIWNE